MMATATPGQAWPELMLELGEALERLGPIRATLSRQYGLILDGRYGVTPAEVIAAAQVRRMRGAA